MHGPGEESANGKAAALALADEIATLAARMDAATHRLLTCIRQFDESGEWYRQGSSSCATWLTWRICLDPVAARERVRVARALGGLPQVDAALERGEISYAKVRVITRVATPENEHDLLELARHSTSSQLDRVCRATVPMRAHVGRGTRRIPPAVFQALWNRDDAAVVLTRCLTHGAAAHVPGRRADAPPPRGSSSPDYDMVQSLVNELARQGIVVDNDTSIPLWDGDPTELGTRVDAALGKLKLP